MATAHTESTDWHERVSRSVLSFKQSPPMLRNTLRCAGGCDTPDPPSLEPFMESQNGYGYGYGYLCIIGSIGVLGVLAAFCAADSDRRRSFIPRPTAHSRRR